MREKLGVNNKKENFNLVRKVLISLEQVASSRKSKLFPTFRLFKKRAKQNLGHCNQIPSGPTVYNVLDRLVGAFVRLQININIHVPAGADFGEQKGEEKWRLHRRLLLS